MFVKRFGDIFLKTRDAQSGAYEALMTRLYIITFEKKHDPVEICYLRAHGMELPWGLFKELQEELNAFLKLSEADREAPRPQADEHAAADGP